MLAYSHWKLALGLWLTVFFAIELTSSRGSFDGDTGQSCKSAKNFLDHGSPLSAEKASLPNKKEALKIEDIDDSKFPFFYMAMCMVPQIGALEFNSDGVKSLYRGIVPAALGASLSVALAYLFEMLGATALLATLLAVLGIFSTPLWHYSRTYYGELQQTLALTLLAISWVHYERSFSKQSAFLSGLFLGVGLNCKSVFLILAPVPILVFLWKKQFSKLAKTFFVPALLGVLPGLLLMFWYNGMRYGDILNFGYTHGPEGRDGAIAFINPWTTGVFGLFLSPGKSIFLYAPVLLLTPMLWKEFWRKQSSIALFFALLIFAFVALYSKFYAWNGDWAWGPRYLMPIFPMLLSPLVMLNLKSLKMRVSLFITGLCGFLVNTLGILFTPFSFLAIILKLLKPVFTGSDHSTLRDDIFVVHFVPDFSPVFGHWWFLKYRLFSSQSAFEDYPWKTMGVWNWKPSINDMPRVFDLWMNWHLPDIFLAIVLALNLGASIAFLIRQLRVHGRQEG